LHFINTFDSWQSHGVHPPLLPLIRSKHYVKSLLFPGSVALCLVHTLRQLPALSIKACWLYILGFSELVQYLECAGFYLTFPFLPRKWKIDFMSRGNSPLGRPEGTTANVEHQATLVVDEFDASNSSVALLTNQQSEEFTHFPAETLRTSECRLTCTIQCANSTYETLGDCRHYVSRGEFSSITIPRCWRPLLSPLSSYMCARALNLLVSLSRHHSTCFSLCRPGPLLPDRIWSLIFRFLVEDCGGFSTQAWLLPFVSRQFLRVFVSEIEFICSESPATFSELCFLDYYDMRTWCPPDDGTPDTYESSMDHHQTYTPDYWSDDYSFQSDLTEEGIEPNPGPGLFTVLLQQMVNHPIGWFQYGDATSFDATPHIWNPVNDVYADDDTASWTTSDDMSDGMTIVPFDISESSVMSTYILDDGFGDAPGYDRHAAVIVMTNRFGLVTSFVGRSFTTDGWLRDLTDEGVEPNPGPSLAGSLDTYENALLTRTSTFLSHPVCPLYTRLLMHNPMRYMFDPCEFLGTRYSYHNIKIAAGLGYRVRGFVPRLGSKQIKMLPMELPSCPRDENERLVDFDEISYRSNDCNIGLPYDPNDHGYTDSVVSNKLPVCAEHVDCDCVRQFYTKSNCSLLSLLRARSSPRGSITTQVVLDLSTPIPAPSVEIKRVLFGHQIFDDDKDYSASVLEAAVRRTLHSRLLSRLAAFLRRALVRRLVLSRLNAPITTPIHTVMQTDTFRRDFFYPPEYPPINLDSDNRYSLRFMTYLVSLVMPRDSSFPFRCDVLDFVRSVKDLDFRAWLRIQAQDPSTGAWRRHAVQWALDSGESFMRQADLKTTKSVTVDELKHWFRNEFYRRGRLYGLLFDRGLSTKFVHTSQATKSSVHAHLIKNLDSYSESQFSSLVCLDDLTHEERRILGFDDVINGEIDVPTLLKHRTLRLKDNIHQFLSEVCFVCPHLRFYPKVQEEN
jgi:hypothetical protein